MAKNKKNDILFNPRNRGSDVLEFDIGEACEEYGCVYGANKNLARITPSLIDGLKPVQRRVLYTLHTSDNHGMKPRKGLRISGDVMGRFHPHGDGSIGDVITNMAQSWNWNYILTNPDGSFGSIRGEKASALRYIESRLTPFSNECYFTDFSKCNVPMRLSYTGEELEPDYLPSKYPMVLINPQLSSIGYGLASNIPPFNFIEVVEATIKLLHNPDAKIMLIPDSPTGCDVVDIGLFKEMNKTGKSKFQLRAGYTIDYPNNIITITSLPLQVTSDSVHTKLVDLYKSGKFDELVDIKDDTKKTKVNLKIILEKSADPDKVIKKLMKKKTGLCEMYSCELRVVYDFETKVYPTKKLLLTWLEYRKDCVRSMYNEKIISAMSRLHMLEVLIFITDDQHRKKTTDIVFKSKSKTEAAQKLIDEYKITSMQATTIADMKLFDFLADKRNEYLKEQAELNSQVDEYERILDEDDGIENVIEKELRDGIKKWGYPRRSKIVKANEEEAMIPNTMHLVGLSKDGFIKKIKAGENNSIGSVGKGSGIMVISINNRDNLLVFDSSGLLSRISVSALPNMEFSDIGVEISRYFKVNGTVISVIRESDIQEHSDSNIVFVTKKGYGKKTSLSEFVKIKDFTSTITLDEGDELVSAIPSLDSDDFIVYTNFGDGIRLSTKDFKLYKKAAKGLSLISLRTNEEVIGIDILNADMKHILYVTSSGRLKLTEMKYFPVMKRRDEPLSLIALEKGESLLGINGVSKKDILVCYRKKSSPVEIPIKDIPVTSRIAKAEKMVKTPKGDIVIAYMIRH